jgi:hypothetical protein
MEVKSIEDNSPLTLTSDKSGGMQRGVTTKTSGSKISMMTPIQTRKTTESGYSKH